MCPAKQASVPSSTKSKTISDSDKIIPAHSICDYNKCDYTKSTIPGSVHNLHAFNFIFVFLYYLLHFILFYIFDLFILFIIIFLSRAVQELGGGVVFSTLLLLFLSVTRAVLALLCFLLYTCLLYTSPSPRDGLLSRMPSSA